MTFVPKDYEKELIAAAVKRSRTRPEDVDPGNCGLHCFDDENAFVVLNTHSGERIVYEIRPFKLGFQLVFREDQYVAKGREAKQAV